MIKPMHRAFVIFTVSAFALVAGCNSSPKTAEEKTEAHADATTALNKFQMNDPSLQGILDSASGYAIFPAVGKGGFVVGGAHGQGTVFQNGQVIGYATISQASIGLQAGGEQFAELIVFKTPESLAKFKNNEMTFTADASANASDKGAAAAAKFEKGVATFIKPEKGLMAGAVIGGQKFNFMSSSDMKSSDMK